MGFDRPLVAAVTRLLLLVDIEDEEGPVGIGR